MERTRLRYQKVADTKEFFRILNNPNFKYFSTKPKTLKEEYNFLKLTSKKRKSNTAHNFAVLYKNVLVGGCGIRINSHHMCIGEIGYFIDNVYWGRGIAVKCVKKLEKIAFGKLGLRRLEMFIIPKNKASIKVAVKCHYKKERMIKKILFLDGKYENGYLFSKNY